MSPQFIEAVCMLDTLHDGLCADETNEKLMLEISSPEHVFAMSVTTSGKYCFQSYDRNDLDSATIDFENFRKP